jgi:Na+-driven multidrug efflux pump
MYRFDYALRVHFLCGTYEITAGALRGMNRSMVPALISVVGTCAVRLLYVFFVFPIYNTPAALILVYPVTWIITCAAMNIAYSIARKDMEQQFLAG